MLLFLCAKSLFFSHTKILVTSAPNLFNNKRATFPLAAVSAPLFTRPPSCHLLDTPLGMASTEAVTAVCSGAQSALTGIVISQLVVRWLGQRYYNQTAVHQGGNVSVRLCWRQSYSNTTCYFRSLLSPSVGVTESPQVPALWQVA